MDILSVTSNNRPSIFIASTTEALPVAELVKLNFAGEADVDLWSENIFNASKSNLSVLLNRASFYDFGIILLTPEDEAIIRKEKYKIPRDNLLFELGLFMGRIGSNRAFMIAEDSVKILSDFEGIDIATYHSGDGFETSLNAACDKLRLEMQQAETVYSFSLLPSTSLAIGYYVNFVEKVANAFRSITSYEVFEKNEKGEKINTQKKNVQQEPPTITILLPKRLSDLTPLVFRTKTERLKQIVVDTSFRPFPFYIAGDITRENNMDFFDIPTTLLSSLETINRIFEADFLNKDNNFERIERREISNFEKTIRILVPAQIENKLIKFDVLE